MDDEKEEIRKRNMALGIFLFLVFSFLINTVFSNLKKPAEEDLSQLVVIPSIEEWQEVFDNSSNVDFDKKRTVRERRYKINIDDMKMAMTLSLNGKVFAKIWDIARDSKKFDGEIGKREIVNARAALYFQERNEWRLGYIGAMPQCRVYQKKYLKCTLKNRDYDISGTSTHVSIEIKE